MKTYTVDKPWLEVKCGLSEGPYLEQDANTLRFVDIVNSDVYRVDLAKGPSSCRKQKYEYSISVTADIQGQPDSFLFGGKYGVGVAKKDSSDMRLITKFWNDAEEKEGKGERMRANDGAVDSQGRFWVSAVCDPEVVPFSAQAIEFRFDPDGKLQRILDGLTIPNGQTWSKDDKLFYFTDTKDSAIYTYDYDSKTGSISNKRIFYKFEEEGTGPDGHAQDQDGNIWVAVWGSWKVLRISPQGEVIAEVKVPTRCPTAVVFADEDIYITSEGEHEPDKYPESAKYAGMVFKCNVGIKGRPANLARVTV